MLCGSVQWELKSSNRKMMRIGCNKCLIAHSSIPERFLFVRGQEAIGFRLQLNRRAESIKDKRGKCWSSMKLTYFANLASIDAARVSQVGRFVQ